MNYRIVFSESEVGLFSVDVPPQLGRGLGSVGGAVDVHLVADVVAGEAPGYDGSIIRQI